MNIFKPHSVGEHAASLAAFLPGGRVFAKGWDATSTLGKLIMGLAIELYRVEEKMNLLIDDHDINATSLFIEQWESAVGIPDECLSNTGTLAERRRNILAKLAKMNVTTPDDFVALAALFGVSCTVKPGISTITFPVTFPIPMFDTVKDARFSIVVNFPTVLPVFPLTFPIQFGDGTIAVVRCLFERLRPANVKLVYI